MNGVAERRLAVVPGVRALLPRYASLEDPIPALRAACLAVVSELGPLVQVVGSGPGAVEVGAALVAAVGAEASGPGASGPGVSSEATGVLVIGNGSAMRTEKAPGHLDERAAGFDDAVEAALLSGTWSQVDPGVGQELWADVASMIGLPAMKITWAGAPYGVAYWVARLR